jgi:hypothetical protein
LIYIAPFWLPWRLVYGLAFTFIIYGYMQPSTVALWSINCAFHSGRLKLYIIAPEPTLQLILPVLPF